MPANTSPDNIVYPVAGDQVAPLEAIFQDLADSVQDALDIRQLRSYRWANAAARTAQTGMVAGDVGYQSDTGVSYFYTGSAWKTQTFVLGTAYQTSEVTVNLANTWVDILSFTATATNQVNLVEWTAVPRNPGSGLNRVIDLRIVIDGTQIGEIYSYDLPTASGSGVGAAAAAESTPATGSRTWKLQGRCITANASSVMKASIKVSAI